MLGKEGVTQPLPEPPIQYKILEWSRDMGISYTEMLQMPFDQLKNYLDMRELEDLYGPTAAKQASSQVPGVPPAPKTG